jgi:hypothetical protein
MSRKEALAFEGESFALQFTEQERPGIAGFLAKKSAPYQANPSLVRSCALMAEHLNKIEFP